MVLSNLVGVKRLKLWCVGHAVGKLTDAGKDTGAVSLRDTLFVAHTEFNSEPIDGGETLELDLGGTERCETDFLGEVCKFLMSEHGGVTHQLMNDIGLRSVKRLFMMSNVLG